MSSSYLHAFGPALPQFALKQEEALDFMRRMSAPEHAAFLGKIHAASAIDTRYSVLSDFSGTPRLFGASENFEPFPTTAARMEIYAQESVQLAAAAVRELFRPERGLRLGPTDVTHMVTASCTGFSAPGWDVEIQKQFLGPTVQRLHLGYMGCLAALPALRCADSICAADRNAKVLVVCLELCTLHVQKKWEPDLAIANALFGDGACACLVSADPHDSGRALYRLDAFASRLIPGTSSRMAWIIGEHGFEMRLSAAVPASIAKELPSQLDRLLAPLGLSKEKIEGWALHPGGRAILDHVEKGFGLSPDKLAVSRSILRDYGNMSSSTVLFVLDRHSQNPANERTMVSAAFGPGLSVELAALTQFPKSSRLRSGFAHRLVTEELMDRADADTSRLKRTIAQFTMLNRLFSSYRKALRRHVLSAMRDGGHYRVLDIGTGGADIPRWLVDEARKRGIVLEVLALEPDARILPWAVEACAAYPEIVVSPSLLEELPADAQFDFIISNHVVHHLSGMELRRHLEIIASKARIGTCINDLRRSRLAYWGYTVFTGLFVHRSLAFIDGRLSIRRALNVKELTRLIESVPGGERLRVDRVFPARMVVCTCGVHSAGVQGASHEPKTTPPAV